MKLPDLSRRQVLALAAILSAGSTITYSSALARLRGIGAFPASSVPTFVGNPNVTISAIDASGIGTLSAFTGGTGGGPTAASATACTISGNQLTVGGTVTGTFAVGQVLNGANIPTGDQTNGGPSIISGTTSPFTLDLSYTISTPQTINANGFALYSNVPVVGGTGAGATVDVIVYNGVVQKVTLNAPGTGYSANDSLSVASTNIGGCTGLTFSVLTVGIACSRISGTTPCFIQVSASSIQAAGTSYPFEDLDFRWNFGDAGSGESYVDPVTGASVNANSGQLGPKAAYPYRNAGNYNITLIITGKNGSGFTTKTIVQPITVSAFSSIAGYSARYVDSNSPAGSGGDGLTPATAFNTLTGATTFPSGGKREVFIANGSVLDVSGTGTGTGGVEIGRTPGSFRITPYTPASGATVRPVITAATGAPYAGGGTRPIMLGMGNGNGAANNPVDDVVVSGIDLIRVAGADCNIINIGPTGNQNSSPMTNIYLDNVRCYSGDGTVLYGIVFNSVENQPNLCYTKNWGMWNCIHDLSPGVTLNFPFTALSYSAGVVTGTTSIPHGLNPGDTFFVVDTVPVGYSSNNAVGGLSKAIAGTSGSTVKYIPVNASFTGSISGTTLTTSAVSGSIAIGQVLSDAGGAIAAGTTIVSGSGSSWQVNISQAVASEAMVGTNPLGTATTLGSIVRTRTAVLCGSNDWWFMAPFYIRGGGNDNVRDHHIYPNCQTQSLYRAITFGDGPGKNECINTNWDSTLQNIRTYMLSQYYLFSEIQFHGTQSAYDADNFINNPAYSTFKNFVVQLSSFDNVISASAGVEWTACLTRNTFRYCYVWQCNGSAFFTPQAIGPDYEQVSYFNRFYRISVADAHCANAIGQFSPASNAWTHKFVDTDNIYVDDGPSPQFFSLPFTNQAGSLRDRNQYYSKNSTAAAWSNNGGVGGNFGTWQGAGFDLNGSNGVAPNWNMPVTKYADFNGT